MNFKTEGTTDQVQSTGEIALATKRSEMICFNFSDTESIRGLQYLGLADCIFRRKRTPIPEIKGQ